MFLFYLPAEKKKRKRKRNEKKKKSGFPVSEPLE
jgi:hypothetical protein